MANDGLLGVPMSFGVGDTLAGSLGAGLGAATPTMISPYASTGTAIGVGLGSILLQSLLGYQARQQAAERTLELNRLSTSLLGMKDAQERSDFIGTLGDTDPLVLGRLGSLSGALAGQEIQQQRALDLERSKKMLGLDIELSPKAQQLADLDLGREIAKIKARTDGFRSRLGSVLSGPTNEMQQFINTYFDPKISVKARTDLQFLTKEQIEAVKSGELSPSEAMQIARRKSNKEERYEMQRQRKEFEDYKIFLKQNFKTVDPTTLRKIGDEAGVHDRALNAADRILSITKGRGDLLFEKIFTTETGLREELAALADRLLRTRSGAAAPVVEQDRLRQISEGRFYASPQETANLLRRMAQRMAGDMVARATTAKTPDDKLVAGLTQMRDSGLRFKDSLGYSPMKLPSLADSPPTEQPTSTTNAPTITQDDRDLLARYNQGIVSEDLKAQVEEVLKSKGLL